MSFKQAILGTAIGRAAMSIREDVALVMSAIKQPDGLAALLNDRLATRLATRLPCNTFVDVGAHIGSVVAEAIRHGASRVIAVEAMPDKAQALQRKFPRVAVHACAVGHAEGNVSFFVRPRASGYSSLIQSGDSVQISVPLRRLDALVSERVDTIKIDVEGAELGVLLGAERVIAESQPIVMFESAAGEVMYTKAAMWDWCAAHQYEILTPDRLAHDGPALSPEAFRESHWYPRRTTNYFAVPVAKRVAVRSMARAILNVEDTPAV
jgi:FkbM family methyltransferase